MSNNIDLKFQDGPAYSTANKPNTDVMRTDMETIETGHNALDDEALYIDGTKPMAGNLNMNSHQITGLAAPTADDEVARKVDTSPIGAVTQFAGSAAPSGWLLCTGQEISRTTYAELFTTIGSVYGSGDGTTTFNVPNLKERIPTGVSTATDYLLGKTGGAKTKDMGHTHRYDHYHKSPTHYHSTKNHAHDTSMGFDAHSLYGWADSSGNPAYGSAASGTVHRFSMTHPSLDHGGVRVMKTKSSNSGTTNTASSGNTNYQSKTTTIEGGNKAQDIRNPYIALNYIIKH